MLHKEMVRLGLLSKDKENYACNTIIILLYIYIIIIINILLLYK